LLFLGGTLLKNKNTNVTNVTFVLMLGFLLFLGACSSEEKPKEEKTKFEEGILKPINIQIEEAEADPIIDIKLIKIVPGTFMMGSDKFPAEKPIHKVEIKQEFYLGKYEVTQEQWQSVMGDNPSHFKGEANLPVEEISWIDTQRFLEALNKKSEKYIYRLPTESEWEYAARAGTTEDFAGSIDLMAWYGANSDRKTHPVGQKKPNAFGLYDMHGNVYEWCEDSWHPNYEGAPNDGSIWKDTSDNDLRVLRGGSWYYSTLNSRSSYRSSFKAGAYDNGLGLRVVATKK
jgi:formylglycine-generating enzyme required for sulfatase activity